MLIDSGLDIVLNAGMSASEYQRLSAAARAEGWRLMRSARAKLHTVYLDAADDAARVVRSSLRKGLSPITTDAWSEIERQLRAAADSICATTESEAELARRKAVGVITDVDEEYIRRAVAGTGASKIIAGAGLKNVILGINTDVIEAMASREWRKGYKFSDVVWGTLRDKAGAVSPGRGWMESIKATVITGVAQGRDAAQIAQDIKVYTRDGRPALVQRWGTLERGTAEFARRLPKSLDWRALRLVRSEIGAAQQAAAIMSGERNPACTGRYRWVLSAAHMESGCECVDLAAGGPYEKSQVPEYPHPNCMCAVEEELMPLSDFVSDLKKWISNRDGYIEEWYQQTYLPAQEAA